MAEDLFRLEGMEELLRKVESLAELRPVVGALKDGGLYLKGKVAVYPAENRPTRYSVYGSTFKTDKQRRFFFWALRKGKIEVPYRRGESPGSQTFGRRWTIATENAGLRVIISNNAKYGPLLMDEEQQSRYAARVGWRTVQDISDEEFPIIIELAQGEIDRILAEKE